MARRRARPRSLLLAVACAALLLASHVAARAVRDALFLSSFGARALPCAMLAAAGVGLSAVLGTARLMARFGPGRVVPAFLALSGALYLCEWRLLPSAHSAAVVLVYLHASIAGGIGMSGLWSVVNERFDPHRVRGVASRLGVGFALGGLLGGLAARSAGSAYGLRPLLLALAFGSTLAGLSVWRLARGSSALELTRVEPRGERSKTSGRYLATMATLVTLGGIASAIVDFVFKASVSSELASGRSLVGFFAVFYMVVSVASVALQLLLAGPLLSRFGLGVGLASVPLSVVVLGVAGFALPGAWVLVLLRGASVALESSLFRAAYEPLYAPLPVAEKRAKKSLIDVACDRLGEALGSGAVLLLGGLGPALGWRAALAVAVLAATCALWLASTLERGYVAELAASLRSGRLELATDEVADATTRFTLSQTQLGLERDALLCEVAALRQRSGQNGERVIAGGELMTALVDGDASRINASLLAGPLDVTLASLAIACLERDETAEAATVALRSVADRIPGQLTDALLDPARPLRVRRRIPRVLRRVTQPRAVRGLAEALTATEPEIRLRAALALRDLKRTSPELGPPRRVVLEAAAFELDERRERALEQVMLLLGLVLDGEALELAQRALRARDEKLRGTALEYLEHVIPEPIRRALWPYLQPGRKLCNVSSRTASDLAGELQRSLG